MHRKLFFGNLKVRDLSLDQSIYDNIQDVLLKTGPLARRNRERIFHNAHKNVLIHKDRISNIFFNIVHLVYQKLNETKSFIDFAVQAGRF
jgi:hypothetical protein